MGQALKQTSRKATILLYSPVLDRHLEAMAGLADRVFCFYDLALGAQKFNKLCIYFILLKRRLIPSISNLSGSKSPPAAVLGRS